MCVQVHTQQRERLTRIPSAFNRDLEQKLKSIFIYFFFFLPRLTFFTLVCNYDTLRRFVQTSFEVCQEAL